MDRKQLSLGLRKEGKKGREGGDGGEGGGEGEGEREERVRGGGRERGESN